MAASIDRNIALTDPIIDGASYTHAVTGETGVIMGTLLDERTGKTSGNLYTFRRGNLPTLVTENSPSMGEWKLARAGSEKTAQGLVGAHRKKHATKE
jgi:hypothetical protein